MLEEMKSQQSPVSEKAEIRPLTEAEKFQWAEQLCDGTEDPQLARKVRAAEQYWELQKLIASQKEMLSDAWNPDDWAEGVASICLHCGAIGNHKPGCTGMSA